MAKTNRPWSTWTQANDIVDLAKDPCLAGIFSKIHYGCSLIGSLLEHRIVVDRLGAGRFLDFATNGRQVTATAFDLADQ